MNPFQKSAIRVYFLLAIMIAGSVFGQATLPASNPYTLYPPLNAGVDQVECCIYVHWQKPLTPTGTIPAGLIGYNVYRGGSFINYRPGEDSLNYFDCGIDYGTYTYSITAKYDLTPYGLPGQFGESSPAGPITIVFNCDAPMPFYEPWDAGSFMFQNWQFMPSQSNWSIDTGQGNPLPTAVFSGSPLLQNYEVTMKSLSLPATPWKCANIYLEFDYTLNDISLSGTEKLTAGYFMDNTWIPVMELKNEGSTGWIHQKLDISEVSGKRLKLGFKASGTSSTGIAGWEVDNIRLSPVCKGPAACIYSRSGNSIQLSWQHPDCDSLQGVSGYNVYRTDENGLPPFNKLNASLITSLQYIDVIPSSILGGTFRYIITDVQRDMLSNTVLCEAPCDTLVVDYSVGIETAGKSGIQFYPQPANTVLFVKSNTPVESCEVFNLVGVSQYSLKSVNETEFSLPVEVLPEGIYMVRIKNARGTVVKKISVIH